MDNQTAGFAVVDSSLNSLGTDRDALGHEYVSLGGERFFAIRNVDRMPPFLVSVVSSDDHWLYASSAGGLAAGRVSPEGALFPYITDDKIHDSASHTGSLTLLRIRDDEGWQHWEPFNPEHDGRYRTEFNLYKNLLGNKLCYEEVNHDLRLVFRYTWMTSAEFGFVRYCELENTGSAATSVEVLDGLQNILPAGTPMATQATASNLVNAYKWSELDEPTGLAYFTLYSEITDRAEPSESLRASTVFALGATQSRILLSSTQLEAFRRGEVLQQDSVRRGVRGAYLVNTTLDLAPNTVKSWQFVANVEQDQGDVAALRRRLADNPATVLRAVAASIDENTARLSRIMARADGFQQVASDTESVHHYANVLFNVMRGGTFYDQYQVPCADFAATIRAFNQPVYDRNQAFLDALPERINLNELMPMVAAHGDSQLERLSREYLPLTFGRRHGDPSRPWNHFRIELKDEDGEKRLSYQGNWRDIFQNWEALAFSYPEFIENVIAKFVNASTVDGYNPYRIGKDGIDWEVEEPDDPWSYIGYWGDHQIIYLAKLLELSEHFHPSRLRKLLRRPVFSYANVPYRIKPFEELLRDPKHTVEFDETLAKHIDQRVMFVGADGKLVQDANGDVYQTSLLEKLLVPLLCKLGNFVVEGGIWLNTQRPEWNDANNALVGNGLSVVTLCYMRRYAGFLQELLADESEDFRISVEVAEWLDSTRDALVGISHSLADGSLSGEQRYAALAALGQASSRYREQVYKDGAFSGQRSQSVDGVRRMLDAALNLIDRSIAANLRADGLFHSYNLLGLKGECADVDHLYPMLEGQVAALSAGTFTPDVAVTVLESLFASDIYRHGQDSFMLYPDRQLPGFLEKNRIPAGRAEEIPLLRKLLDAGDNRLVYRDADGWCRFRAGLKNAGHLRARLDMLSEDWPTEVATDRQAIADLYEEVFRHRAFTGRSGTMFGYEGLGSIYWHMVSKLLLAVQENFFAALQADGNEATLQRLGELYYRVRQGLGFNKSPAAYGAFPTDPYSHTPKHNGASQPGMTGQVKEEVLSRFGELGIRVTGGAVTFAPRLLRRSEFLPESRQFSFFALDETWRQLTLPSSSLGFTWCQVPVVYQLDDSTPPSVDVTWSDGTETRVEGLTLPADVSTELFLRSNRVRQLTVSFGSEQIFAE